jgi:hypothetical protein
MSPLATLGNRRVPGGLYLFIFLSELEFELRVALLLGRRSAT